MNEMFLPREILKKFDHFLGEQHLKFEGIIIGGAAIGLLHREARWTRDFDLLTPIPEGVKKAAKDFALIEELDANWLNNRVVNLESCKPMGWGKDTILVFQGDNITLSTLSRMNLLRTKVFAFCDRSEGIAIDLPDIESMAPSMEELDEVFHWTFLELRRQKSSKGEIKAFEESIDYLKKHFEK